MSSVGKLKLTKLTAEMSTCRHMKLGARLSSSLQKAQVTHVNSRAVFDRNLCPASSPGFVSALTPGHTLRPFDSRIMCRAPVSVFSRCHALLQLEEAQ